MKKNKLAKKELTMFVNEIILVLNSELQDKYITQRQYKDYINYIRMAADQIFIHHPKFHKEVTQMLIPTVFSYSEMEDKIEARTTARVTAEVTAKVTNEVTAEFQDILQKGKEKWTLKIRLKDSQIRVKDSQIQQKNSEIAILRAALEANGVDVDELLAKNG